MTLGMPPGIAAVWGHEPEGQRGPKREYTIEHLVSTAVTIADAEGLQAVTMQRLASSLGCTPMALYRYVSNKGELEMLMWNHAMLPGPETVVDGDDWKQGLRDLAHTILGRYRAHPWLEHLSVPGAYQLYLPAQVRLSDLALRAMRTLPLPTHEKFQILSSIGTVVVSFVGLTQLVSSFEFTKIGDAGRAFLTQVITPDKYPDLVAAMDEGTYAVDHISGRYDDFDGVLNNLIDGVSTTLMAAKPKKRSSQKARGSFTADS